MSPRQWTLREDHHQHHHGVVRLAESPLFLRLYWKATAGSVVQLVGLYRLNLRTLLEGRFIRSEGTASPTVEVRLRFVREGDGIYIQVNSAGPQLLVGTITR